MALLDTHISTSKEWLKFFIDELNLSPEVAQGYADEFSSQHITSGNILVGLSEPGFLNQLNMSLGHQLELKTKFLPAVSAGNKMPLRPNNKVPTPTLRMDVSQVEFDQFQFEWERYKEHYNIQGNAATSLFFCCSDEVRQQLRITQSADNSQWNEDTMMESIKSTVLSKVSSIVHIKQFLELKQESGESVQRFLQKLQAKASCCNFYCRSCQCSNAEERVREKFILGLKDSVIQKNAVKTESVSPNTPLNTLLTEALTLEQSTRDQKSIAINSSMNHATEFCNDPDEINALKKKRHQEVKCSHCGGSGHSSYERREKCPAWGKKCTNCGILNHFHNSCLKPKRALKYPRSKCINAAEVEEQDELLFIGEINSLHLPVQVSLQGQKPKDNPVTVDVFPDTGANICLIGPTQLKQMKLKGSELVPCVHEIGVAGGSTIKATGKIRLKISLGSRNTTSEVYYAKRSRRFFLSRQCCSDLNIIPRTFPYPPDPDSPQANAIEATQNERAVPNKPQQIPFEPIAENIPALKNFILKSFSKSAFNCQKPFPALSTPPARIHLKPNYVVPAPAYWPATVAEHWAKEVKASIDRDVEAGILTKVPLNEPTEWCARMVVVKKKDGRPRRTVDFQDLNKQCLREPNHGTSPFHTARQVPDNMWKSTFDAVDGYHSVKLDEASSKLTTFTTPWGRYRYLRFPQGHCSAGDAFNGRVQEILSCIPRLVRIVDDMCIYDKTIEQAFWHAWDLLTVCAKNGIVVNESKFQFCALEVDFAGLTISVDGVKPSANTLKAIKDFPPPSDLSKARAFFGLLNQVQWAYANSSKMAPFRELVKPNSVFQWTPELKQLFEEAKNKILEQVQTGVRHYDVNRIT